MGHSTERVSPNYFKTEFGLEDAIDLTAWHQAGIKPNGQLQKPPYDWPKDVRENLKRLNEVVQAARESCTCEKKHRKENLTCAATRKATLAVLATIKVNSGYRYRIADALATLVHLKKPKCDRSAE